jgi:hypothetical protein
VCGFVAAETSDQPQLSRFSEVLHALLPGLPQDPDALVQLLTSLGALSDPSISRADLADFLLDYRSAMDADAVAQVELALRAPQRVEPVSDYEEPQPVGEDALDLPVIAPTVARYTDSTPGIRGAFAESPRVAEDAGAARVLVWTRDGLEPESLAAALLELEEAGFVAVSGGRWAAVAGADSTSDLSADGDTIISGRGHDSDGEAWSSLVAEALLVPAATLLGDTTPLPGTGDAGSGDGDAAGAAPTADEPALMPPPDARPLGDVDVVLGIDYLGCQRAGTCVQEGSQP